MSVSNHQQLAPPSGMATAINRSSLPESRAQLLEGFRPARLGTLQLQPLLKNLTSGWPATANICGTAVWLSSDGQYDTLLVLNGTALYSIRLFYTTGTTSAYRYNELLNGQHSQVILGSRTTVLANSSIWSATAPKIDFSFMFGTELIFAIDGVPYRYYRNEGTGAETLYSLGLIPGGVPTLSATTGGSMTPDSTYGYLWTFVDEFGRESSPSDAAEVTLNASQNAVTVTRGSGTTGGLTGIASWNIYRLNPGADTYNYVATVAVGTTSYLDTASDDTVAAGDPAPEPGENDPPSGSLAASFGGSATIGCVWKNRVVLNYAQNSNVVQISNAGSPTQFSAIALPTNIDDGLRLSIYSGSDNEVTGLANLGSLLAIFTRQSIQLLFGDDITDYQVRPVHMRGCANPDSVQRCENVVFFLSDDGVYSLGYENGYAIKKVSTEIDNYFHGFTATRSSEPASYGQPKSVNVLASIMGNVNSFYFNNVYYLSFGNKTLCYDFIANGWADTGWGFVKTVSPYLSQNASIEGVPDSVFLTIADVNSYSTQFKYFTLSDSPGDVDAPTVVNARVLTRCFDGDGPPINRKKRMKRFSLYGEVDPQVPKGTPIGTLTAFADDKEAGSYPIYNGWFIDAPDALYQQEFTPLMTGYELYFLVEITNPTFEMSNLRCEYSFLN